MGTIIIIKYAIEFVVKLIGIFIAANKQQKIQIIIAAMVFAITIVLVFALSNVTTDAMQDLMHQLDEMSTHQEETAHEESIR